jgi:hypothetical protein
MAILEPGSFTNVFADLLDKRVAFVKLQGNIGDKMNARSTAKLFRHFNINFKTTDIQELSKKDGLDEYDEIVVSGGGNMGGDFYKNPFATRQALIGLNLPITILPQSFIQNDEDLSPYKKVFVRERESLRLQPGCELAPDLALGYRGKISDAGTEAELGVFLRTDMENMHGNNIKSLGDPVSLCKSVDEYFRLASKFERVVTDRLHFCIAALLLGRNATLLPNSYFKNHSFYQTWLSDICEWQDDLSNITYDKDSVENKLYQYLSGPPSKILDWNARPMRENGYHLESLRDGLRLIETNGVRLAKSNEISRVIWQLCDGSTSINEIIELLSDSYEVSKLEVAKNTQLILSEFKRNGAIVLDMPSSQTSKENSEKCNYNYIPDRSELNLTIQEPVFHKNIIRYSAILDGSLFRRKEIWFEFDASLQKHCRELADPFLLIALMHAMREGRTINVSGAPVSAGLISNLWHFQQVWCVWRRQFKPIDIIASEIKAERVNNESISTFSGGIDSCHTIYNALVDPNRKFQPNITAALTIHGFDIPLGKPQTFVQALNVELITVRTNSKEFVHTWLDEHGLILGAATSLFSGRFGGAVIAGTLPYSLMLPMGSNVVTDRLMSSDGFQIEHHGAESSRLHKVQALTNWKEAHEFIRVCWNNNQPGENCNRCIKCVMAAIMYDLYDQCPDCLHGALREDNVKRVLRETKIGRLDWHDLTCITTAAAKQDIQKWWLQPVREAISKFG